jgi:two-component system, response regulator YesN
MIPDMTRAITRTSYRVLVAEDEPRILLNIAKKIPIADPGFTVAGTAENGEEALRLARELAPDLVLTDIVMPMMDGLALIGALRVHNPTLPIAIISGYAEFEYARKAIDLGVEDYLLKPVKVEALRGLLKKVRTRLEGSRRGEENFALHAAVERGAGLPAHMGFPQRCVMLLLSIGNLLETSDTMPPEMRELCERCWRSLDGDPAIVERQRIARHWLVELGAPNQKLLVLSCGDPSGEWIRDCADRVLRALRSAARPWAASAAISGSSRPLASAYETAQSLRSALEEGQVPGRSKLFTVAGGGQVPSPQIPLSPSAESRLRVLKRDGAREHLLAAVLSLVQGWVTAEYPQKILEKGLDQLVSLFEQPGAPDAAAAEARLRLHATLVAARDPAILPEALSAVFDTAVLRTALRLDARGIAEAVEEHLSRGYMEPLSLEQLSRSLGFDLSHVTRIFKRFKGESPMQYLTRLRLQRARELLEQTPEIDVKTIGSMVGYTDAHYFARIFKKVAGLSPSEYRCRAAGSASTSVPARPPGTPLNP